MGHRPARVPTWAGIIPERRPKGSLQAPPDEWISRRAGDGENSRTGRPESELDAAVATCVENRRAGLAPPLERRAAGVCLRDTAGDDGQFRGDGFYPLGR